MLFQIEILAFLSSFLYILYYFWERVFFYVQNKKVEMKERETRRVERSKKQKLQRLQKHDPKSAKKAEKNIDPQIKPEQSEQIREISKRAQINIERGYYESARSLIVEGLALKKQDKELNLLLADVYEREKKFQNAEYIYRDLLDTHGDDLYMLQRLWNIYVLRGKTKKAEDTYTIAHKMNKSNTEILDILSHVTLEQKDFKKALKYANLYLKEKPRNIEKLGIKWYTLEKLARNKEAIETYSELLQLQPYNSEVQERVAKLAS